MKILYNIPLIPMPNIPIRDHYGSFGVKRKFSYHCGVDLYTEKDSIVYAVEDGIITEIAWFTGPKANLKWWHNTRCICVEGDTGVVVYGEISVQKGLRVGGNF